MNDRRIYPKTRNSLTTRNLNKADRRDFLKAVIGMWPAWVSLAVIIIILSFAR